MGAGHEVHGFISPGFEAVRDRFRDNFDQRGELGGGVCAYQNGQKVVDLWGGVRNTMTGEPWQDDTIVLVHSATKGLAAMTLAMGTSITGDPREVALRDALHSAVSAMSVTPRAAA